MAGTSVRDVAIEDESLPIEEERLQIALYKLRLEDVIVPEGSDAIDVLHNQIKKVKGYSLQGSHIEDEDFDFELYHQIYPEPNPRWKGFLESVAEANADILKTHRGSRESFILLVKKKSSGNLYAITGGLGYFALQGFIDEDFGIDILSRLIKKEDQVLMAVKEMSFVGSILGSTKHFRKNFNFYENDGFGKIYQELKASLDYDLVLEYFNISREEFRREPICIAKSSFTINKSITFEQLLTIINGCETIIEKLEQVPINSVEKVDKKKNRELIERLRQELGKQLWKRYENPNSDIDFDLCHGEFESYLTAEKYIITKGQTGRNYLGTDELLVLRNIDDLFSKIKEHAAIPLQEQTFLESIPELVISSYAKEEDVHPSTRGFLIDHIFGDILYKNKRYFLIAKNWYLIKDSFVKDLNTFCGDYIKKHRNEGLKLKKAASDDEDSYNGKYIGEENTLVLHRIFGDSIELCDILKWNEDEVFLYYVKAGFGNSMRDLCYQVSVSASRITQDENGEYLKKIYRGVKSATGDKGGYFDKVRHQSNRISEEDFVSLFKSKSLVFVLAIWDKNDTERSLESGIKDFRSNIAKFALRDLAQDIPVKTQGRLAVNQIFKAS